jgi:hypothetical protein
LHFNRRAVIWRLRSLYMWSCILAFFMCYGRGR